MYNCENSTTNAASGDFEFSATNLSEISYRICENLGWGKGGNVTSVGWQVTLCDPVWHVNSRSGVAG